jgi:general secretion pathway protein N
MGIKQKLLWVGLGLFCIALTILAFAPASWLDSVLQKQTDGRLALGDVQGSVWNGSAFIGVAASKTGDLSPLLPGRFSWHLSPIVLLGQIDLTLENSAALHGKVTVTGNFRQVSISPGALILPSERLSGLGAPLNTVKPEGKITLSWDALDIVATDNLPDVNGTMKLAMQEIGSALSPIKPLGSYLMTLDWRGQNADMVLTTTQGPLMLSGKGGLVQGRLHFSGQAQAQEGQEDKLANLLNLLGQRQPGANKNVIALEFK